MRLLVILLLATVLSGCATSEYRQKVTVDSLRAYYATRMAEDASARITVTVRDPRVESLKIAAADSGGEDSRKALLRDLHQRGVELAARFGLRLLEDYPLPTLGLHAYIFEAERGRQLDAVIPELEQQPGVEGVRRTGLYRTQGVAPETAADPLAPLQAIAAEDLARLHDLATGRNVTIVVIDTGIDVNHEDLAGADLRATDMVNDLPEVPPETHATSIAGLILAQPGNGVGIRGFAPDARVIVLRACWQRLETEAAFCNSFTLAKALSAALETEPDVVNLSLTGPMDPLLSQLVAQLLERNVIVIAANQDQRDQGPFPSALPGVIAATGRPLLARDPGPVYAPDRDIITLLPHNRYGLQDGSSISAAQVTGIASLFRELSPSITAGEFEAALRGRDSELEGMPGLLDALRAIAR